MTEKDIPSFFELLARRRPKAIDRGAGMNARQRDNAVDIRRILDERLHLDAMTAVRDRLNSHVEYVARAKWEIEDMIGAIDAWLELHRRSA